jgi:hypothetical protein
LHTFSHSKSGTLTVNKASLTVTADNESNFYGASNPTFTVSYSAFANGDTATDLGGALGFDTNAMQQSSVGSYAITPKGLTSDNYAITFKDGTLTINKSDLTLTAGAKSKIYGEANPTLAAGFSGYKNGDSKESLGGTLAFDTQANQSSPVGTYAITPSDLPAQPPDDPIPGALLAALLLYLRFFNRRYRLPACNQLDGG